MRDNFIQSKVRWMDYFFRKLGDEAKTDMLINVFFAFVRRADGPAFGFATAACVAMAATLAIFFVWTYPANVATQNWTVSPANWDALRRQWEYSHAVNAGVIFVSFCCVTFAALWPSR